MDLLQALHAAEFEELAIMHDIIEALAKLSDDKGPDNSSTVSSNPSISPCPEFSHAQVKLEGLCITQQG